MARRYVIPKTAQLHLPLSSTGTCTPSLEHIPAVDARARSIERRDETELSMTAGSVVTRKIKGGVPQEVMHAAAAKLITLFLLMRPIPNDCSYHGSKGNRYAVSCTVVQALARRNILFSHRNSTLKQSRCSSPPERHSAIRVAQMMLRDVALHTQ